MTTGLSVPERMDQPPPCFLPCALPGLNWAWGPRNLTKSNCCKRLTPRRRQGLKRLPEPLGDPKTVTHANRGSLVMTSSGTRLWCVFLMVRLTALKPYCLTSSTISGAAS